DRSSAVDDVAVIVPGDPASSELLRRIESDDPWEAMPPPEAKKKPITPEQRQILRRWIREGARYQRHWSFEPPQRPSLPEVENPEWISQPLDAFVLARLEQEKLTPSPQADRQTLIRRLSFDLTGLPPTAREVEA